MMPSWYLLVAAIVLLLFPPLISTQIAQSNPPPSIDLKNFDRKDGYFIRAACDISPNTPDSSILQEMRLAKNDECDAIIHTRKRGESNLLVEIEIQHIPSISGSTTLDKEKSIKIKQDPFEIECKPDGEIVSSDSDIKLVPIASDFITENRLFCSFIMKSNDKLAEKFKRNANKPQLSFFQPGDIETILKTSVTKAIFWTAGQNRCDPDLASFVKSTEDKEYSYDSPVQSIEDQSLTCSSGLLYIRMDPLSSPVRVETIKCEEHWEQKIEGSDTETVLDKPFEAMCRTKHCSQCTTSTLTPFSCSSCSKPVVSSLISTDKCVDITCSSNMWILDEKWMEKPNMTCDRTTNGNYEWKANGVSVKEGACTTDYDCFVHSALIIDCDDPDAECEEPEFTNSRKTISCNRTRVLRFGHAFEHAASTLECQTNTGLYLEPTDFAESVPRFTPVACLPLNKTDNSYVDGASQSSFLSDFTTYIGPLIMIVVILIITAIIYFVMQRHHEARFKREETELAMERMKESEQRKTDEMIKLKKSEPGESRKKRELEEHGAQARQDHFFQYMKGMPETIYRTEPKKDKTRKTSFRRRKTQKEFNAHNKAEHEKKKRKKAKKSKKNAESNDNSVKSDKSYDKSISEKSTSSERSNQGEKTSKNTEDPKNSNKEQTPKWKNRKGYVKRTYPGPKLKEVKPNDNNYPVIIMEPNAFDAQYPDFVEFSDREE